MSAKLVKAAEFAETEKSEADQKAQELVFLVQKKLYFQHPLDVVRPGAVATVASKFVGLCLIRVLDALISRLRPRKIFPWPCLVAWMFVPGLVSACALKGYPFYGDTSIL